MQCSSQISVIIAAFLLPICPLFDKHTIDIGRTKKSNPLRLVITSLVCQHYIAWCKGVRVAGRSALFAHLLFLRARGNICS